MEAGPNSENTIQENKNQAIKVEDFFVNYQNNIVNENGEKAKYTNDDHIAVDANFKNEYENLKGKKNFIFYLL